MGDADLEGGLWLLAWPAGAGYMLGKGPGHGKNCTMF